MKFVLVGAGALGTIFAAQLIQHGHEVQVVARGKRAQQLRDNGLLLQGLRTLEIPCSVVTNPADLAPAEALIVTTKTYQTAQAIEPLANLSVDIVFSAANGVRKDEQLAEVFGASKVIGCMADISGELLSNGAVEYTRNVCLHLGPLVQDPQQAEKTRQIVDAFSESEINTRYREDILSVEWSKFVGWVAFMSLAVITQAKTVDFLCNSHHARFAANLIREMSSLALEKQIPLIDQSPMPVKTISTVPFDEAVEAIINMGQEFKRIAPEHRMSSLQDLQRGARLEYEDTLGHGKALAKALGISCPTIEACYELVAGIDWINRNS